MLPVCLLAQVSVNKQNFYPMGCRCNSKVISQGGLSFSRHGAGQYQYFTALFLQFTGDPDLQTLNILPKCLRCPVILHLNPSGSLLLPKLP